MKYLAALQFLTTIPIRRNFTAREIGRSAGYFPLVGLTLGLVLVGLNWFLIRFLPSPMAATLLIAVYIFLTGALHLDGFLDLCDGLGVRENRERMLEVMRDSRVGAMGVIGACCLLLIKYTSLIWIPYTFRDVSLILMPVIGRFVLVYCIWNYPYIRTHGAGSIFKEHTNLKVFLTSLVISMAIAFLLGKIAGLVLLVLCWIPVEAASRYFNRKLGGLTGDIYGAVVEISETFFLVLVCAFGYSCPERFFHLLKPLWGE